LIGLEDYFQSLQFLNDLKFSEWRHQMYFFVNIVKFVFKQSEN